MFCLFWLAKECPDYFAGLEAFAYDSACTARRHVDAKVRDLPQHCEARKLYERVAKLKFFVDNFHFKNHKIEDKYCQETTNPKLYPEYSEGSNTEVSP